MATVKSDFGRGTLDTDSTPALSDVLRDMVDDLGTVKVAAVVAADAGATAVANATDLASSEALVNDLKAKYNAMVTLVNELKTKLNAIAAASLKSVKG